MQNSEIRHKNGLLRLKIWAGRFSGQHPGGIGYSKGRTHRRTHLILYTTCYIIYYVRTHAYAYTHVYGGWFTLILRFFRKRKDKECKITANHVRKLFMIWHYPYASCTETGLTERFRSGKTAEKRDKKAENAGFILPSTRVPETVPNE